MEIAPTPPNARTPNLEPSWLEVLAPEFDKPYMRDLRGFLVAEMRQHSVCPPGREMFNAFWLTPFDQVRVVILGQDPYHGPGQAHGLCFSVRQGIALPPSLENVFKELHADLGVAPSTHGDLSSWARQGVLLLNTVLSVRARAARSHAGKGWETFTDKVIEELVARREGLVFVLWGNDAGSKAPMITTPPHRVIRSSHPSPYSAHYSFFGSRPFSRINQWLRERGQTPIDWALPPG